MYMHVGYINNIHPEGTIICMLHVTCGVYTVYVQVVIKCLATKDVI